MTLNDLAETIQKFGTVIIQNADEEPQIIHFPQINFYGCSFNFANDGCAESRYYGGNDIYNPRKEVENEPVFPDGR